MKFLAQKIMLGYAYAKLCLIHIAELLRSVCYHIVHIYGYSLHIAYLNLSLKNNRTPAKINVQALVTMMGVSFINKPYTNQRLTPTKNKEKVLRDKSLAERIFQVFTTCGKKAIVVSKPAVKPNNCTIVFDNLLKYLQNTE
jgi:hypothetical protein